MDLRLRVRRARRDDLDRVRSLLGAPASPLPAERKRWRRLVSTLREDLYLAEREEDAVLVGLVVIVYARGLGPPAAIVRHLLGASDATARALLECARTRALAHGCARLEVQLAHDAPFDTSLAARLLGTGWQLGPQTLIWSFPQEIGPS